MDALEEKGKQMITNCHQHVSIWRYSRVVYWKRQVQDSDLEVVRERIDAHRLVVIRQNRHHLVLAIALCRQLVYRYGVHDILTNLLEANAMGGAEKWWAWARGAAREVEGKRGVARGRVGRREASDLDGGEVAVVLPADADVSMASGGAAGVPREGRHV
jgi:hypothetical protein